MSKNVGQEWPTAYTRLLTCVFRHAEDPSGGNRTERAEGVFSSQPVLPSIGTVAKDMYYLFEYYVIPYCSLLSKGLLTL